MQGLFLRPDAAAIISEMPIDDVVKHHALELLDLGYTVVRNGVPEQLCKDAIAQFRRFEESNSEIFSESRDANGHYPRIVNLHTAVSPLLTLFTRNTTWLQVQDVLFGAPTALYTSLFYEVGSQQPLHRDSPVFATRPEYLFFGTTVYLEDANDQNGCLEVMERGHLIGELDREKIALSKFASLEEVPSLDHGLWNEYQDEVVKAGNAKSLLVKEIHVKAGDSLIWHPLLPHGGSVIKDSSRTRFSLVMHTTPVGVPVYHQDVYFNPIKEFSTEARWGYEEFEGRKIAEMRHGISVGHVKNYALNELKLL